MTRHATQPTVKRPKVRRSGPVTTAVALAALVAAGALAPLPADAQGGSASGSQDGPCKNCEGSGVAAPQPITQPPEWPAKRLGSGHCRIQDNNFGQPLPPNAHGDALFQILSAEKVCPENALRFRDLVVSKYGGKDGVSVSPSMVANRSFNHPLPGGEFSFFEAIQGELRSAECKRWDQTCAKRDEDGNCVKTTATCTDCPPGKNCFSHWLDFGDFFFGHFMNASTDANAATSILSPANQAAADALMFESVVWDPRKGMFNFYEVIASGQGAVWYYRGDSYDILADIRKLNRNYAPDQLLWGDELTDGVRLRCSGCHVNGGPIMKELAFPNDSWWRTERPLRFGSMRFAPEVQKIFDAPVVDAGDFAQWVRNGVHKLLDSDPYWRIRFGLSLQEQLRPLFCEHEVNLESDTEPFERPDYDQLEGTGVVRAPVGFFVNPRLLPEDARKPVVIDYGLYRNALINFESTFVDDTVGPQPTDSMDADHAFETPVKAWSDHILVGQMIKRKLIHEDFALDVLAVDMTRPMFSRKRCGLLRLVPLLGDLPVATEAQRLDSFHVWVESFKKALHEAAEESDWPGARELLGYLDDPHDGPGHRERARALIEKVQSNAFRQAAVTGYVRLLAQRRIAVFHAEVSQNPQGQIFEPDFRLIFPTMQLLMPNVDTEINYGGVPGQFWLNPETGFVELAP